MNRAVKAKLENPDMPLITALVTGGFVFPDLDNLDGQLGSVKDTDNVTGKWKCPSAANTSKGTELIKCRLQFINEETSY